MSTNRVLAQFTGDFGTLQPPVDVYQPGTDIDSSITSLELFLSNLIGIITVLAGLGFMLFFVFGAMTWILAGGDEGRVSNARKMMVHGIIGLTITLLGWAIVTVVGSVLGLPILNPGEMIRILDPNTP